jgi:potassium-transporting ATPase potassium-binding subunit
MYAMSGYGWLQLAAVIVAVAIAAPLLGRYLAAVHGGGPAPGDRLFAPIERLVYRVLGVTPSRQQQWPSYAGAMLAFGAVSTVALFLILRVQDRLPLNPTDAPAVPSLLAFNTAASFATGTNWQAYAGESTMSHFSQMAGLVVAQFTAAAVGMSVAVAVVRGLLHRRRDTPEGVDPLVLGNFWVDLVRNTLRVLLPIAVVASIAMISQGAVQNLDGNTEVTTVEGGATQVVPGGLVASQEVMKTLGTNGGGFYNVGSAHPFGNPTGLTSAIELVLVLAIPFAFPLMYGRLSGRRRHGATIAAVMAIVWLAPVVIGSLAEADGNPALDTHGVDQSVTADQAGGNMEGKDVRFGPNGSVLLSVGTMGTSAGVTPAMLDSYTPTGGATALGPILLGEISPGGVGTGLTGMLVFVIIAVFVGGLMVGRTPEYLGKKVRGTEMKLATLYILIVPILVLAGTAASVLLDTAKRSALNPGAHGFTEMLYAFASAANGNGSAFAGLNANTDWYNVTLGLAMLGGRFLLLITVLAVAGSLARGRIHASTSATLQPSGPTFGTLLLGVVLIVGGLTYLPAMMLGPLAELP